ncbi:MAG: aminoacyl-tRNA hydrolase [Candidatus Curtissbacteria bacterium]|nr:aminoacyl-tRNA hydrolase [Candidatus Curtissbacteria bacterium]
MKLIVGLGNPGEKFKNNRHSLGFIVVDMFAIINALSWRYSRDFICYYAKSSDFVIIKPSTFMNKSGEAVKAAADYFKIEAKDVLVVHDELDLDFGKIRITFNGSSAGHNGVESVVESLGTLDFSRLRIGIGHPRDIEGGPREPSDYVLSDFTTDEKKKLSEVITRADGAVQSFISEGVNATMNQFN